MQSIVNPISVFPLRQEFETSRHVVKLEGCGNIEELRVFARAIPPSEVPLLAGATAGRRAIYNNAAEALSGGKPRWEVWAVSKRGVSRAHRGKGFKDLARVGRRLFSCRISDVENDFRVEDSKRCMRMIDKVADFFGPEAAAGVLRVMSGLAK